MSDYIVQPVGDDELPDGVHSVIVEREGSPAILLINGPAARSWHMLRAWAIDTPVPTSAPSAPLRGEPLRAVG